MKKVMMIVLIILAVLIVIAAACFGGYCYKNLHWYDRYEKALKSVNAVEKQFTLPSGRVINYGEVQAPAAAYPRSDEHMAGLCPCYARAFKKVAHLCG